MEYSKYLFDVNVSKLADKLNCEKLLLRDVYNKKARYNQVVVMMLDDTVRCVLRADSDENFGEYYFVATYCGNYILVKEENLEYRRELDNFYIAYIKAVKEYGKNLNDDEDNRER